MTESELFSAMSEVSVLLTHDFEFFITATFALIVVSYVVGDKLPLLPRVLIAVLYAAAVAMLLFRYQAYLDMFGVINTKLAQLESAFLPDPSRGAPASALRLFIYIAGSVATLYVLFRPITPSEEKERAGDT